MTRELVWQWLESPTFPRGDFERCFADWDLEFHEEDGVRAAAALLKGTEIHFVVAPEWRRKLLRRDNTRAFLARVLAARGGTLSTRILRDPGSDAARSFVRRIGFQPTWSDATFDYFELYDVPFARKTT